jgi:predicted ABC-type ATPase
MFAGPNGSGKTTVKTMLRKPAAWFGVYVNPDDIEQIVRDTAFLSLGPYHINVTTEQVRRYFASSEFLRNRNLQGTADALVCRDGGIDFSGVAFNSYHASVLADYRRRQTLESGRSFTFETVMSARDKVELLKEAQARGFRTYLYYIATEDPEINIQRVKNRVADGGHDVPERKIVERYHRSLNLLTEAIRYSNRAFMFDTSEDEPWYFAEITDGKVLDIKDNEIPNWFNRIWNQFHP